MVLAGALLDLKVLSVKSMKQAGCLKTIGGAMKKFLKNWGPLTIAIIAVVASVCALYLDHKHLELQQKADQETRKIANDALAADMQHHEEALELGYSALAADEQHHKEALELGYSALAADEQHHDEALAADEQHFMHAELGDDLLLLYDRLTSYGIWLMEIREEAKKAAQSYYDDAVQNWYDARRELNARDFGQVQKLIAAADANLQRGREAAEEAGEVTIGPLWIPEEEELPVEPLWIPEEPEPGVK